jgi:hypothetical protein
VRALRRLALTAACLAVGLLGASGAALAGDGSADDPGPFIQAPSFLGPDGPPLPRGGVPALGPDLSHSTVATDPFPATPPHALIRGISDGTTFVTDGDARESAAGLRHGAQAGAQVARLPLIWPMIESHGPPADVTDPADPAYDFTIFDAAVRRAVAEGLQPMVRIDGVPSWAESLPRWRFGAGGTWAPNSADYGRFALAAARRYSGRFPDPLDPSRMLPAVHLWQAWNEPNLPRFFTPQWVARDGRWAAWSPEQYRRMLNAFYAAVKSVDPANVVATAGTAPNGDPRDGAGRMSPVRFWQQLLCLGTAPKITLEPCPDPAHLDVLVHHPFSIGDPDQPAASAMDVSVADLGKLRHLLRIAQRTGRVLPARGTRVWVTEINWNSPPTGRQATLMRWVPRGLYLLWREGVSLVSWQFIRDPAAKTHHPAGLYAPDPAAPGDAWRDRPKPVLKAFRFPFVARTLDRRHVGLWALLPPGSPVMARATLQVSAGGRWRRLGTVRADGSGMVRATVRLSGQPLLRLAVAGHGASPAARVTHHRF